MKRKYKWIFALLLLLVSAGAYLSVVLKPLEVETEQMEPRDLTTTILVQATVIPKYSSVVNAVTGGELLEFPIREGEQLNAGSVAARLGGSTAPDLDLQLEQYRQQLSQARQQYESLFGAQGSAAAQETAALSQYELAERNYQNAAVLFASGDIAQTELETLKTARDVAKQQLVQAREVNSQNNRSYYRELITSTEKQLKTMEATGQAGDVLVPYQGIVWETYAKTGEYVQQNQPLFRMYRSDQRQLEASVLAEDAVLLKEGMDAEITFADGLLANGTVTFISQVAKKQLSSVGLEEYRCTVEVMSDAIPEEMGAGYLADVRFSIVLSPQALTVPASALVPNGIETGVYVLDGGKAVFLKVETGERSGGRVEIKNGIKTGDFVIADPYSDSIQSGSRVKSAKD